ncbi:hypothetical protein SDC9_80908 [bioreactor metagenome]|uniref:Peptidase S11 D-alanyl-D-alanine carboxypeptidase A N-terminal domain-containing protein n=1 Tax=bioreactor metagenome TaxID=1076179 RepID=A0A644Z0H0_9ZZZZ
MLIWDVLSYLPYGAAAGLVFLVVRRMIKKERTPLLSIGITLALALCLTVIFAVTVAPLCAYTLQFFGNSINLIPFAVLKDVKDNPWNFYGNMLLFIPVGVLPMLLWDKFRKLSVTLCFAAGLSALIETLQLFSPRGTDIDDVILNTAGAFWGFVLGKVILKLYPELRRLARRGKGQFAVLAGLVLLAVFARGDTLPKMSEGALTPPPTEITTDPLPNAAFDNLSLTAKNVVFMEMEADTALYEKGADEKIAPASTAKLLTALTVLDICGTDDEVTVGNEVACIAKDASRAWLAPKNRLSVKQLLYAMLLPSGNDAAYTLAVYSGRQLLKDDNASIDDALEAFMEAANKKAEKLGASSSHFISPDGYDAEGQYTTARDLAVIAKAFAKRDTLIEIAAKSRVSLAFASGQQVTYENTNELINPASPYYFKEATGLKTGTSEAAGCCLVSSAKIDGKDYLCIVMGDTEEGRWEDTWTLYGALSS